MFFIFGFIISYIFFSLILQNREKTKPKIWNNLEIKILNGKCLHFHHWIIFSILLIILIICRNNFNKNYYLFLLGFCLGGIFQGLKYKDRFEILQKCII
jgi:hypothetical protein